MRLTVAIPTCGQTMRHTKCLTPPHWMAEHYGNHSLVKTDCGLWTFGSLRADSRVGDSEASIIAARRQL